MNFVELRLEAKTEAVDAVTEVFRSYGVVNISVQSDDEEKLDDSFISPPVVVAYIPLQEANGGRIKKITEGLWHLSAYNSDAIGYLETRPVSDKEQSNLWAKNFYQIKIGDIIIKPTWRQYTPTGNEVVIEMNPSMGFGSGLHSTTRLMCAALQKRIKPGMNVLDVGSGSGILSIAAIKLGANHVDAVEPSGVAISAAEDNYKNNNVAEKINRLQGTIDVVSDKQYDLVLANITAGVLIDISAKLRDAMKPGTELLSSGIVSGLAESVKDSYRAVGLYVPTEETSEANWRMIAAGKWDDDR